MLNYGAPSWFYGEITEFKRQTVVCKFLLGHRSFVYVAVSDMSYIAESVASMLVCLLCSIDG